MFIFHKRYYKKGYQLFHKLGKQNKATALIYQSAEHKLKKKNNKEQKLKENELTPNQNTFNIKSVGFPEEFLALGCLVAL